MEFFHYIDKGNVRPELPLIYKWEVKSRDGAAIYEYVGRAVNGEGRPRKDYARNVKTLLSGGHWHGNPSKDFREVHWVLAGALVEKYKITLRFLCNCTSDDIDEMERQCQEEHVVSNSHNRESIDKLIQAAKQARANYRKIT